MHLCLGGTCKVSTLRNFFLARDSPRLPRISVLFILLFPAEVALTKLGWIMTNQVLYQLSYVGIKIKIGHQELAGT